jgi:hypothetical protein
LISFGDVPANSVLPVHFGSYNAAGASVALTGLAVTDVEIYKGTSITQRSSDAGIALIDTDGIDIDGITGANGFSIDLSDNTDAGFYAVGSFYNVWVSAVTIDSQTVNFLAATFRIREAETTTGRIEARVGSIANGAITAAAIATDAIDADALADGAITAATFAAGAIDATAIATGAIDADAIADNAIDAGAIAANAITAAKIADGAIDAATFAAGAINAAAIAADAITAAKIADGAIDAATFAAGAITATVIATGAIDADALAADAVDEIWDEVVEGAVTARQSMRLANSANAGKASGMETTNPLIRDLGDTKNRIDATVDADGNRSAVTLDLT